MGRPPTIDRTRIIATALDLADRGGLQAVTMAAVAAALSVSPMALYRHVADKDDLLDGLVDQVLTELLTTEPVTTEPVTTEPVTTGWVDAGAGDDPDRTVLVLVGRAVEVAHRHPAAFVLLLTRPVVTDAARSARARVHALVRGLGVAERDIVPAERVVTSAVLGLAAGFAAGRFSTGPGPADLTTTSRFVLAGLRAIAGPTGPG